jgi:AcrR family transcriptional regulator
VDKAQQQTKTAGPRARGLAKGRVEVPFQDPISSLPKTAQKILIAARKLLVERGYEAMTLENVAAEAEVNKASIRYNFGNKAGLVTAVMDAYIHDECLRLVAGVREAPAEEVIDAAIAGMSTMVVEAQNFQGYFDILPYAFREPELRERMLALYKWWYLQNLAFLGLADAPGVEENETLVGLGELVCAVIDGLCIQAGLQPDGFDMTRAMDAFGLLLRTSMSEVRAAAGLPPAAPSAG